MLRMINDWQLRRKSAEMRCAIRMMLRDDEYPELMKEYASVLQLVKVVVKWKRHKVEWDVVSDFPAGKGHCFSVSNSMSLAVKRRELERKIREGEQKLKGSEQVDEDIVFVEVHPGVGGHEAVLFSQELCKMYLKYAQRRGWEAGVVLENNEGVVSKVTVLRLRGRGAYSALRFESGSHRVQRIPRTETQGRVHTSVCKVATLLREPKYQVAVRASELRIDTFRSSGSGGQHVNKTDSAVRVTHLPTGIVVQCQSDRSQHRNRANAMETLGYQLLKLQQDHQNTTVSKGKKDLMGSGSRPTKVRTYNFPQHRITDHRLNRSFGQMADILAGELDIILNYFE